MRLLIDTTAAMVLCAVTSAGLAVTSGQVETFASGTLENWDGGGIGGPTTATNVNTGGPAGVGDEFLQITSNEFHLGTKNEAQWTGNYMAAGIDRIAMDVNSMGPSDVDLRIVLFGPGGMWATTARESLTTGGGWAHIEFGLTPADLTYVQDGTGQANDTLMAVTRLMIRHDSAIPTPIGNHPPHITADLGIDNIQALPEPATLLVMGIGVMGLVRRRRS